MQATVVRSNLPDVADDTAGTGLFDQGRLCMFTFGPKVGFGINTPFLAPNWAAYVPLDRFADTVPWIMQNRGLYDVFVHPNSGCFVRDTLDWSVWGGSKWQVALPSDRSPLGGARPIV